MQRFFLYGAIYFGVSIFVAQPYNIIIVLAFVVFLSLSRFYANEQFEQRLLRILAEGDCRLEELIEKMQNARRGVFETIGSFVQGSLSLDERALYWRLREWSGDPIRPFHPFFGTLNAPGDEDLPRWIQFHYAWVSASEVRPEVLKRRRRWEQTEGAADSPFEKVRMITIRLTEKGQEAIRGEGTE